MCRPTCRLPVGVCILSELMLILGYSSCVGLLPATVLHNTAQYCCVFYSREARITVTIIII